MYRTVSVEEHPGYSLAFIEFDDQGELWAPSQLDRALDHLERLNQSEDGIALVLFVHGWNSDASPREEKEGPGTVYRFRALLDRLDRAIRREVPDREVPVMGVYLGWRGRISSVALVREASFYNRRAAAERIAGAPTTEAIYRILTAGRENPASRSVLIGHSFGSLILERALSQAVVGALLAPRGDEVVFPADLVVLLNPAGSASQTKQLVDILGRSRIKTYRTDASGRTYERPLLVSLTSRADHVTRRYLPLGMKANAVNKKFRTYGEEYCSPISTQRSLYTHSAGHIQALHSHQVEVSERPALRPEAQSGPRYPSFLSYEEHDDPETQQLAFSFDGEFERFSVRRKPRALNDTPYWIMHVPKELIPNHSDVLNEDTFRFVEALLVMSGAYDAEVTTRALREDGVRPVSVIPRPDGAALFLDRNRGVYSVARGSRRPVFVTCLEPSIDPSQGIGFQASGNLAHVVLQAPQEGEDECRTEVRELRVDPRRAYASRSRQLGGSRCYSAATVDTGDQRVFLSFVDESGVQLWVADLGEETPRPELLVRLPDSNVPTVIAFDPAHNRLVTATTETGTLWEIDLRGAGPTVSLVEPGFGWPTALTFDASGEHLYVGDAQDKTIWRLDCREHCRDPSAFLQAEELESPSTLAMSGDSLWVGDLSAQRLLAVSSAGIVVQAIENLSGQE
jgi:hypothetical protein